MEQFRDLSQSQTLAQAVSQLYEILQVLRSPQGCPWDRQQTIATFCKNLIEESYEYIDAFQTKDVDGCHEEIGDLMMVIIMLGIMHEEKEHITLRDMIDATAQKLVRRHPHVFDSASADHPEQVVKLWDSIKENVEGKKPTEDNFFHHVPKALPPLDRAGKIQKKAKRVGFDWDNFKGTIDKLREELDELEEAAASAEKSDIEEEIGDMLFSMVNISRHLKVSSSLALHRTNEKFIRRFNRMRSALADEGIQLHETDLETMDHAWNQAKKDD